MISYFTSAELAALNLPVKLLVKVISKFVNRYKRNGFRECYHSGRSNIFYHQGLHGWIPIGMLMRKGTVKVVLIFRNSRTSINDFSLNHHLLFM